MISVTVIYSVTVGGYTASWAAMSYPKISAVVCTCLLFTVNLCLLCAIFSFS